MRGFFTVCSASASLLLFHERPSLRTALIITPNPIEHLSDEGLDSGRVGMTP